MSPMDLHNRQYRQPFEPFTITTPDGRTFAITAPTQMLVTRRTTVAWLPGPSGENESFVLLNTQDVTIAEPDDDSAPHIVPSA